MYEITVDGMTRHAAYVLDPGGKLVMAGDKLVEDPNISCDLLQVGIYDDQSKANIHESWLVLNGKPRDIVAQIEETLPIAMMDSNRIFDVLDKIGAEDTVTLTYSVDAPMELIRNSKAYKDLHRSRKTILTSLFGYDIRKITDLDHDNAA